MLSRVHQGKILSEETRQKMSEARKGKTQSAATKAKRIATLTGRKYSPERCQRISEGRTQQIAERKQGPLP